MDTSVAVEMDEEFLPSHEILRENLKQKSKRRVLFTELKCGQCGKIFPNKTSLTRHIQTHTTACLYECRQCPYKGKTKKYLSRHVNLMHKDKEKQVKCPYCDKRFRFKCKMLNHVRIHTGEKPHKCDVCGKAFSSIYSLQTHNFIHTDEKPFKCSICEYSCRDCSTLRKHEDRHIGLKRYLCTHCGKRYSSKTELSLHVKGNHVAPDARDFVCDQCKAAFKSKSALMRHQQLVHKRTKACECSVCGKYIKSSYNLAAHMRAHVDTRPYKCTYEECRMTFKDKTDLKRHSIIHYPQKHVTCKICERSFARKHRLEKHILKIHENPNTMSEKCEHCGVCFLTKNYLAKHIKQKHGFDREKYMCDLCDFASHNKPSLIMHIKHKHVYKKTCTVCGKSYKRTSFLKLHYKNMHNIAFKIKPKTVPEIQIKEEPLDPAPDLEIDLLDIGKEEPFAGFETEYTDDVTKIYKPSDDKEFNLHQLFKKMIHDPEYCVDDTTDNVTSTKAENRTGDSPRHSPMPLEELIQQDMFLLVVGDGRVEGMNESDHTDLNEETTNNTTLMELTNAEIRTEEHGTSEEVTKTLIEDTNVLNDDQIFSNINQNITKSINCFKTESSFGYAIENTKNVDYNILESITDEDILSNIDNDNSNKIESISKVNNTDTSSEGNTPLILNVTSTVTDEIKDGGILTEDVLKMTEVNKVDEDKSEEEPMMVDEFKQKVIEDNVVSQDSNETFTIDKHSAKLMKQRIQELIMKQRLANKIRRTDFGRRLVKKVPVDEARKLKTNKSRTKHMYEAKIINTFKEKNTTEKKVVKRKRPKRKWYYYEDEINTDEDINMNKDNITEDGKNMSDDNTNIKKDNQNTKNYVTNGVKRKVSTKVDKFKRDRCKKDTRTNENRSRTRKSERSSRNNGKLILNTFQCYVCYKLFETKHQLLDHCQHHFDICSEHTLAKCPLCNIVTHKDIIKHMRTEHKEDISISFMRILDRKDNESGSRYFYDTKNENAKEIEIIPSVKILNKKASMELDKRNRYKKNKVMLVDKLVKKDKEWIVLKDKFDASGYVLPNSKELDKNDPDYLKKLKKLGVEGKKNGVKMLYPCNKCEKVCQNLSAVTVHSRIHDPNKKPFAPKVWKHKTNNKDTNMTLLLARSGKNEVNNEVDTTHRNAKPKPIVNKHKCDPKLKEFYENNIRGLNIEFWQFLKIYNKMDRENINDFDELQKSTEYGLGHNNYHLENQKNKDDIQNSTKLVATKTKENCLKNKNKTSVAKNKNKIANVKNKFTRTIRLSRKEHNERIKLKNELRARIANSENTSK